MQPSSTKYCFVLIFVEVVDDTGAEAGLWLRIADCAALGHIQDLLSSSVHTGAANAFAGIDHLVDDIQAHRSRGLIHIRVEDPVPEPDAWRPDQTSLQTRSVANK